LKPPALIFSRNPISSSDMANASVTTILKYVFYDDYHFAGARSFDNDFTLGYPSSGQLIPAIAKTKRTMSYPTGSRTRILGTTTFLSSTQYYAKSGESDQVKPVLPDPFNRLKVTIFVRLFLE
jgi:hypothetical protein